MILPAVRPDWIVYEAQNRRAHEDYLHRQGLLIVAPRDQAGRVRATKQVRRAG
jgi:hypothetical protein